MKIFIFIFFFLLLNNVNARSITSSEENHYQKGLKFYIQRDYRKATEEWQKALQIDPQNKKIKEYFEKAQDKFSSFLNYFYSGVDKFKNSQYQEAAELLKQALLINPLDERTAYYLRLCMIPEFDILAGEKEFDTSKKENYFVVYLDTKKTVLNWVKEWEITLEDPEGKVVRVLNGNGKISETVAWDMKDNEGDLYLNDRVFYYLTLTSLYGRKVQSRKNSVMISHEIRELVSELPVIMFEYAKADLRNNAYPDLEKVVDIFRKYPQAKFIIEGHTDDLGTFEYNMDLAKQRSLSVYEYLKTHYNIPNLKIKSFGSTKPKLPNTNEENRRKNRRVEIVVVK